MKFIYNLSISVFVFGLLFYATACGDSKLEGDGHNHTEEMSTHQEEKEEHDHDHEEKDNHGHEEKGEHKEGEIHLSKEQIKTVGIKLGDLSSIKINDYISATGTLGLPPQSYASVSAKANGFIKNSNKYVEGSYVKKGAIMAYVENTEFIEQQQKYLEISAELTYLEQELTRQKELVAANAGVIKNLQKLTSEVNVKKASLKGLAMQLTYLGINIKRLSLDNIIERIAIVAPMSGYVTSIDVHNGMYVTREKVLMDIISENHLHLELDVFEKDIAALKEEQKISYTVPALGTTIYEGEVHVIGKEFNTRNKTVRIHGHLGKERPKFIKGLFVDAKIWLNNQIVEAVPENAIIKDGSSSYIYITGDTAEDDEVKFEPFEVIPGTTNKGYTAVKLINKIPEGMIIVTEGAYYVYAQSKAGELEHEH